MNDHQTRTFTQAMEVIAAELIRLNGNLEKMFAEIESTLEDKNKD